MIQGISVTVVAEPIAWPAKAPPPEPERDSEPALEPEPVGEPTVPAATGP